MMRPPPFKLPYLQSFRDRHGKWRYYYAEETKGAGLMVTQGRRNGWETIELLMLRLRPSSNAQVVRRPDLFAVVAEKYQRTPRYAKLASSTKGRYKKAIDDLVDVLGDAPIDQVTRGVIIQLGDKIAEKSPRNAIEAVKTPLPIESLYLIVGYGGKPMTPDYLSHGLQKECR